ncbi:hypothetical protein IM792_00005, partial [Mucilaginibacter sp. JRF]|uniref:hypothetical protein n=1 Tax=Mucilaginibacter sp. JRF TaxID=2780088 RepID=UPI0018805FA5
MENIDQFISALPEIAKEPLAVVAYIILLFVWLFAYNRKIKSKDIVKIIDRLPENERAEFAKKAGYNYDEISQLSHSQRMKYLSRKYFLLAYIVTLITIIIIILSAMRYNSNGKATSILISTIETKNKQFEDSLEIERHRSNYYIRNIEKLYGKTLTLSIVQNN